jgi:hypothetical protein
MALPWATLAIANNFNSFSIFNGLNQVFLQGMQLQEQLPVRRHDFIRKAITVAQRSRSLTLITPRRRISSPSIGGCIMRSSRIN